MTFRTQFEEIEKQITTAHTEAWYQHELERANGNRVLAQNRMQGADNQLVIRWAEDQDLEELQASDDEDDQEFYERIKTGAMVQIGSDAPIYFGVGATEDQIRSAITDQLLWPEEE